MTLQTNETPKLSLPWTEESTRKIQFLQLHERRYKT